MLEGKLTEFMLGRLKPVVFLCDKSGIVQAASGCLEYYQWSHVLCAGKQIADLIPALHGRDLTVPAFIPFIEVNQRLTIGVEVQGSENGLCSIIIVDQSEEKSWRQQVQQAAKSEALTNEKLNQSAKLLNQKNDELDRAYQAKNEFIAGVSHELRTPLSSIIGHTDAVKMELVSSDNEIVRKSLDTIGGNARHLLALLENILEQGRLTADSLILSPDNIDMPAFAQTIVNTFEPIARNKRISLTLTHPFSEGEKIFCDEHYLRLVLVNLLSNALKFTPEGEVRLVLQKADKYLNVEINDTGIGMSEETLSQVFQPFKRGSNVKGISGVGLGLNIVNEVVSAMGGKVDISSSVGVGTSVRLKIPLPELVSEEALPVATSEKERIRVLLVEDDPDLINLYKLFISKNGMEPIVSHNFAKIREELKEKQPNVIVLDYNLGDITGLEILADLRQENQDIPVIMFTATTGINDSLRQKVTALGCSAFLYKPRDMTRLSRVIQEVVSNANRQSNV